jgi:hypothetical protein
MDYERAYEQIGGIEPQSFCRLRRQTRFSARIVVILQSSLAVPNDLVRCLFRLLGEDVRNYYRIAVDSIDQAPSFAGIIDT